jgi:hypothetical protein
MTTQHKNFENISGGSRNDALPMYIHLEIPKSCETVPLKGMARFLSYIEVRYYTIQIQKNMNN